MSNHPWAKFTLGLVTIQFETAFIVGAAEGDGLFDATFVADANGLPCIPGESLAGVLRHALAGKNGPQEDERCRAVFGFQDKNRGSASLVRISFAHVHGKDNRPVAFRGADTNDSVLSFLAAGVGRDHVRIGAHGAVDGRGKFDELMVPAGARFTFELCLADNPHVDFHALVGVLQRAEIRIGGKSRRGLGRISVQGVRSATFDLTKAADLDRLAKLPTAIDKASSSEILKDTLEELKSGEKTSAAWVTGTLTLRPIGTWMVGGGTPTGAEPARHKDGNWDRVPLTERKIVWRKKGSAEQGSVEEPEDAQALLPGSSLKGSLRHRTAFHARRLNKQWLDARPTNGSSTQRGFTDEEIQLFGDIRSNAEGLPGRILLSDTQVTARSVPIQHVSLDRFTQSPMDHLLYDEVALGDCELRLTLSVQMDGLQETAVKAFRAALDDICKGRLAVGAGRGHGRFRGQMTWSDDGQWIGGRS